MSRRLKDIVVNSNDTDNLPAEKVENFRAIFEHTPFGAAQITPDGRFCWVNEKLCESVDRTEEELLDSTLYDLAFSGEVQDLQEYVRLMLAGENPARQLENRFLNSNGSVVWFKLTLLPLQESSVPRYCIVLFEDVSERKQTEDALEQSRELYSTVVEQAAENIFLVDAETRRIIQANAAFHRLLGYTEEDLERGLLYDLIAYDDLVTNNKGKVTRDIERILEGQTYLGEQRYRKKNGWSLDVEVNASAVHHRGRDVLCVVSHDISERKRIEKDLRHNLDVLLALREAGQILGSTLDSDEVILRLLEIMRGVSGLSSAIINITIEGELRIWRAIGVEELWSKARYETVAERAREAVLTTGEPRLYQLHHPEHESEMLYGFCLPLNTRDQVIGVLECYGPRSLGETDAVNILLSLANQAASALENARLYEQLADREKRLGSLVQSLLTAQEKERRRVAFEVHDGLAQMAAATHQHLQAFARFHPPSTSQGLETFEKATKLASRTASEARRVVANLRPTTLDDFGLRTAIRLATGDYNRDGWRMTCSGSLQEGERLPSEIETALFRIAQEALTNVRKHANTRDVHVEIDRTDDEVILTVQDQGQGFDEGFSLAADTPGERLGLSSMRERVSIFGGTFDIQNSPDTGTKVTATIPLPKDMQSGGARNFHL